MERQIQDQDIKPLIKLTLLTHTNHAIDIKLPFFKKFQPHTPVTTNTPIFLPLFHTIILSTPSEQAEINLQPLIHHLNNQHYLHVQTYSRQNKQIPTAIYALHIQFAQTVVWENQGNQLNINFKRLALAPTKMVEEMEIHLKVSTSHSCPWTGQPFPGNHSTSLNQNMSVYYQTLLDNVNLQVYRGEQKLCECKKYIFQLLSVDHKIYDLLGTKVKGQIKIKATTHIPIIVVD